MSTTMVILLLILAFGMVCVFGIEGYRRYILQVPLESIDEDCDEIMPPFQSARFQSALKNYDDSGMVFVSGDGYKCEPRPLNEEEEKMLGLVNRAVQRALSLKDAFEAEWCHVPPSHDGEGAKDVFYTQGRQGKPIIVWIPVRKGNITVKVGRRDDEVVRTFTEQELLG